MEAVNKSRIQIYKRHQLILTYYRILTRDLCVQETNPEKIEEKARMIYEDFVSILSPREVSVISL